MSAQDGASLFVSDWLNVSRPDFQAFEPGKVLLVHAFQMLCPGCIYHSLPQLTSLRSSFSEQELSIVGLHSVFEHHNVMTPTALKAFVNEMGITYPVAIDAAGTGSIPLTMANYQMQGTPSILLFTPKGNLRLQHFGRLNDMQLSRLVSQALWANEETQLSSAGSKGCSLQK